MVLFLIEVCKDAERESKSGMCKSWAKSGYCEKVKYIMSRYCPKECKYCSEYCLFYLAFPISIVSYVLVFALVAYSGMTRMSTLSLCLVLYRSISIFPLLGFSSML